MSAFQSYLQQKFHAATLPARFGITGIGNFNQVDYIQANRLATWNRQHAQRTCPNVKPLS